jgi:hypothetical protein
MTKQHKVNVFKMLGCKYMKGGLQLALSQKIVILINSGHFLCSVSYQDPSVISPFLFDAKFHVHLVHSGRVSHSVTKVLVYLLQLWW